MGATDAPSFEKAYITLNIPIPQTIPEDKVNATAFNLTLEELLIFPLAIVNMLSEAHIIPKLIAKKLKEEI